MNTFISIIFVFCIIVKLKADNIEETDPKVIAQEYMRTCLEENDISPDFFDIQKEGDSEIFLPTKSQMNCYIACLYKKVGIFDEDGMISKLNSKEEEIVEWNVEQRDACIEKAKGDICELAGCLEETQNLFT